MLCYPEPSTGLSTREILGPDRHLTAGRNEGRGVLGAPTYPTVFGSWLTQESADATEAPPL